MPPIQQKAGASGATTTLTLAMDAVPVERNTLVLALSYNSTTGTITSVAQTGVTWTSVGTAHTARYAGIYVGSVAINASTTVLITVNTAASKSANVSEWGSYTTTTTGGTQTKTATSTNPTTGTITTTSIDALAIAVVSNSVDSTTPTNSFVALTGDGSQIGAHLGCAYREVTAAGAYTTGWTAAAGSWDDIIAAFVGQNLPTVNGPREIV